jgi:hypothetical protein
MAKNIKGIVEDGSNKNDKKFVVGPSSPPIIPTETASGCLMAMKTYSSIGEMVIAKAKKFNINVIFLNIICFITNYNKKCICA